MTRRSWVAVGLFLLTVPGAAFADHAQHPAPVTDVVCLTTSAFSPHGGVVSAIATRLDAAQQTIWVAAYSLTHPDLVAALIAARGRGVVVVVKADKVQSAGAAQSAALAQLEAADIPVEVSTQSRLLHDKFAVIDGRWVITGSFNWTASAENRNRENLLILDCPDLARNFTEEWDLILPGAP